MSYTAVENQHMEGLRSAFETSTFDKGACEARGRKGEADPARQARHNCLFMNGPVSAAPSQGLAD